MGDVVSIKTADKPDDQVETAEQDEKKKEDFIDPDYWENVQKQNQATKERMERDRQKKNQGVIRSYRLKR